MKKSCFIFIIFSLFIFVSCGGSKSENKDGTSDSGDTVSDDNGDTAAQDDSSSEKDDGPDQSDEDETEPDDDEGEAQNDEDPAEPDEDVTESVTDLAGRDTANCYIVSKAGSYKFPLSRATEKEFLSGISTVGVLWETDNTGGTQTKGSIITNVGTNKKFVFFDTPSTLKNGNAVIVAYQEDETIVWKVKTEKVPF